MVKLTDYYTTTGRLADLYPDHTLKLGVVDLVFTNPSNCYLTTNFD